MGRGQHPEATGAESTARQLATLSSPLSARAVRVLKSGGMQHFLNRAVWDTDGSAPNLREFVVDYLGEPDAVLVIDETGDVKKGDRTVAVQRQYTGTAGRVENAQVAIYLTYTARAGHTMIDGELYLPRIWTDDPYRCAAAGIPPEVEFTPNPPCPPP